MERASALRRLVAGAFCPKVSITGQSFHGRGSWLRQGWRRPEDRIRACAPSWLSPVPIYRSTGRRAVLAGPSRAASSNAGPIVRVGEQCPSAVCPGSRHAASAQWRRRTSAIGRTDRSRCRDRAGTGNRRRIRSLLAPALPPRSAAGGTSTEHSDVDPGSVRPGLAECVSRAVPVHGARMHRRGDDAGCKHRSR
jgi:hypothetical protein